jgi:hypothetical protein
MYICISDNMIFKSYCLIYKSFFALKYYQNFIIHQLGEWEDDNNWFLKTSEVPTNPILKIQ